MSDQRTYPRTRVHLPKECVMDVSIKSTDKQAREAFIKAREDKQAAKDRRDQKRKDQEASRRQTVTQRRLRRRIRTEVHNDLLAEKKNYLKGEATGNEYEINTVIRYKRKNTRYKSAFVKEILKETLAKHTGFEYKADFETDYNKEWCNRIRIWYTLLEH